MTHDRIQEVTDVARANYDALASFCDSVALLDMCHSFADNVTQNPLPWCRHLISERSPRTRGGEVGATASAASILTNSGAAMMIRNGRYGIISDSGLTSGDGSLRLFRTTHLQRMKSSSPLSQVSMGAVRAHI